MLLSLDGNLIVLEGTKMLHGNFMLERYYSPVDLRQLIS